MADFCKHCSIELFGKDYGDHANISTPEQTKEGLYAVGICEGCSGYLFDHTGECVLDCNKHHGKLPMKDSK